MNTYNDCIEVDTSKGLLSITVKMVAENFEGEVNITDVMLQGGHLGTLWSPHVSEIKWSVDK